MELWIEEALNKYQQYLTKTQKLEKAIDFCEKTEIKQELALLKIQRGTIESWFALFDEDEKIIVRQMLLGDQGNAFHSGTATRKWMQQLLFCGQAPWIIRERAIGKITEFSSVRHELMGAIFYDH